MAILKVIFPHKRNGKFLSAASYVEVPDNEVESYLRVDTNLGIPFFAKEKLDHVPVVRAPKDFFEEANKQVEESRKAIIEAELAEEVQKVEKAEEKPVAEEPAVEELVAQEEEEVKPEEPAPEVVSRRVKRSRNSEQ